MWYCSDLLVIMVMGTSESTHECQRDLVLGIKLAWEASWLLLFFLLQILIVSNKKFLWVQMSMFKWSVWQQHDHQQNANIPLIYLIGLIHLESSYPHQYTTNILEPFDFTPQVFSKQNYKVKYILFILNIVTVSVSHIN